MAVSVVENTAVVSDAGVGACVVFLIAGEVGVNDRAPLAGWNTALSFDVKVAKEREALAGWPVVVAFDWRAESESVALEGCSTVLSFGDAAVSVRAALAGCSVVLRCGVAAVAASATDPTAIVRLSFGDNAERERAPAAA